MDPSHHRHCCSPPAAGGKADVVSPTTHPSYHTAAGSATKVISPLPSGNGGSHHTAPPATGISSTANNKGTTNPSLLPHPTTSSSKTSPIHFIRITSSSVSPSHVTGSILNSRFQRRGCGGGVSPDTTACHRRQLLHPLPTAAPPLSVGEVTQPPPKQPTATATRTQFVQTDDVAMSESEAVRLSDVLESMESSMHTLHSQRVPPSVCGVVEDMKNTLRHISTAAARCQGRHRYVLPTTAPGTTETTDSAPPTTTHSHTTYTATGASYPPISHHHHSLIQLVCLTAHLSDKAASKGIT